MDDAVLYQLRLRASQLPVGTSANGEICPFCNGGRGRERSLSIQRVAESLCFYRCWRASCGRFGRLTGTHYTVVENSERSKRVRPIFSGDTRQLGEGWLSELSERFGLVGKDLDSLGWRETTDEVPRLVVPIRSPNGLERGMELRTRKDGSGPKTLHYRTADEVWMGWYGPKETSRSAPVVLVEDVISAAKVGISGIRSASLMGSHLSLDQVLEAAAESDVVLLALDRDATEKALHYRKRYSLLSTISVVPLQRDLKYETSEDIVSIVTKATT